MLQLLQEERYGVVVLTCTERKFHNLEVQHLYSELSLFTLLIKEAKPYNLFMSDKWAYIRGGKSNYHMRVSVRLYK